MQSIAVEEADCVAIGDRGIKQQLQVKFLNARILRNLIWLNLYKGWFKQCLKTKKSMRTKLKKK